MTAMRSASTMSHSTPPSREVVDAVGNWVGEIGASLETAPREYDYAPGYYAVFLHDPDGLKVEVVHHRGWD